MRGFNFNAIKIILKNKRTNIMLLVLLVLLYAACFAVPYARVFNPEENVAVSERWRFFYIFQDKASTLIFMPFGFLLAAYLLVRTKLFKKTVKILMIVFAVLFFLLGLSNLLIPVQNFTPLWAVYISVFVLPVLILYLRSKPVSAAA